MRRRVAMIPLVLLSVVPASAAQPAQTVIDGVPLVHWRDAAQYYDREAMVYGRIVLTRNIGTHAFLNFDEDYREHFTALVQRADFSAFAVSPEILYRDKLVAVRGTVIEYRNKPEIIVSSPAQIVVLPDHTDDIVAALRQRPPQSARGRRAPAPIAPSDRVTVATVNLSALLPSSAAFCESLPAQQPGAADGFKRAAAVLTDLDADVVAVQWGSTTACLRRLNSGLLADLGYSYLATEGNARGTVDCAVLSRYPLSGHENLTAYRARGGDRRPFERAPLKAEVQLPAGEVLTMIVVHLPEDAGGAKSSQRKAEAGGLRALVDDMRRLRPAIPLMVAGGFGESLDDVAVRHLRGSGDAVLAAPGYSPPQNPQAQKPLVARIENFILTSPELAGRYMAGSTRIEQDDLLQAAVAVSFRTQSGGKTHAPGSPPQPAAGSNDDF